MMQARNLACQSTLGLLQQKDDLVSQQATFMQVAAKPYPVKLLLDLAGAVAGVAINDHGEA